MCSYTKHTCSRKLPTLKVQKNNTMNKIMDKAIHSQLHWFHSFIQRPSKKRKSSTAIAAVLGTVPPRGKLPLAAHYPGSNCSGHHDMVMTPCISRAMDCLLLSPSKKRGVGGGGNPQQCRWAPLRVGHHLDLWLCAILRGAWLMGTTFWSANPALMELYHTAVGYLLLSHSLALLKEAEGGWASDRSLPSGKVPRTANFGHAQPLPRCRSGKQPCTANPSYTWLLPRLVLVLQPC